MKAIAVKTDESRPQLIDVPVPEPKEGEALLRTLRVGIDGTDHEVIRGNHGGFPEDDGYQILGHEAVAVVEDSNGTALEEGQLVVPTVRRPPAGTETNRYFERGEPDMAPEGHYVERGIVGAHGYMSEFFTSKPEFLVNVPDSFAKFGFLVEPVSNSEKAFEHAYASRSAFTWEPESAVVLGNGPLGLLTLAMLETSTSPFDRNYCLGRRDRPDPTVDIIERLGGTYVDSRDTPVSEIAAVHEPMDFVYEATGYAKHAFETVDALAPNGVGALLGIPSDWEFEVDGGSLHRNLVLENKALFGSVNSNYEQYEAAIDRLKEFPEWFVDEFITGVYSPENAEAAFEDGDGVIKTVVEFDTR
ncbi:glucose dehydrogenase [Haloprofundus marisrubri]|uniref:Glucose 1-dehydrogenase n=1 Tax=Haloprofundus marisrubri TaxID=1514971 RepID=A0A0W1RFN3_9EURY|nr:glucose 1-dehydrogenase [Haloprofundus marisrubri]KTG11476.1 glucose dehydrogenase [Haloprofundus marisrubri]